METPDMTISLTGLHRGTGIENPGPVDGAGTARPDPEVPERARRRTFTAKYKLAILAAYDAAPDGEKGALLRREGLYSSHIDYWRKARDAGALAGLGAPRGRPRRDPREERIGQLEQDLFTFLPVGRVQQLADQCRAKCPGETCPVFRTDLGYLLQLVDST
jgi:transposase